MRSTIAGIVTVATTLTLTLIAGPANAADPTESAARLIEQVAPDQGEVQRVTATAAGLTATIREQTITAPRTADGAVQVGAVQVILPDQVGGRASVANDGTVVYSGTGGSVAAAIQILDDASVRLQTITREAGADRSFTYTFPGLTPVKGANGTVDLLANNADGSVAVVAGTVAPAWARDAKGRVVKTSYRISGDRLVQVVEPTSTTTYPVVADPKVTHTWWNQTMYFNKSETNKVSAGASAVQIAGTITAGTMIGAIAAVGASIIQAVAQYAMGNDQCIKFVVYASGTALPQPYGGSEAGGYCK
ncbi:hypothetical protein [Cellulomonas sp.]|uniref:hypothetical protein n=1 Tax=Cellulomonas sp. TaxID=40001 RepID=UPI001B0041D5|nr:hypothetical protein [Cellulomonas sp.]MBO9553450.1 hypothetical protein [Cellulomonas sp.]